MATMKDVAERAGVSVTTVSHVVNETRQVSDGLRQRVLKAMEELGYRPNALARSLRRKETKTIGMIMPDSSNTFFAEVAKGIEDTSFEQGYNVILCNSDEDPDKEFLYARLLIEKQVDGIILFAAGDSIKQIRMLQKRNMPLVMVDREVQGVEVDAVLTDNVQGGEMATRHLLELRHRRIGCITGFPHLYLSIGRLSGYHKALEEYGVPVDDALIMEGDFQCKSGYSAVIELLKLENPPTAIFACNDLMAIGAISAAAKSGKRIPDDLSVVGFDDVGLASYSNPPLTTVAQSKYKMGITATRMLLERMQNQNMPQRRQLLGTSFVLRGSTSYLRER